jgi:arabinose-5-phosphate isomerase
VSIETARRVLAVEADAVRSLIDRIGPSFEEAERLIAKAEGRIIVSGLGKSGIVGRKISATFSSIGVPSFFLHPVEGAHGDIGMVMRGDVALVISKSGSTDEIISTLNHFKRLEIPLIAMTANQSSNLAALADVVLDITVPCEACPFNIVPTSSTTATLALGDALAMSLLERKGLTEEDFALLHPGGTVGRKLTYHVRDLMVAGDNLPLVDFDDPMRDVVRVMTDHRLGIAILTHDGRLAGVITDGDLRRLIQRVDNPLDISARESLARTARENEIRKPPVTIDPDAYVVRAVSLMEQHEITSLVVTGSQNEPVGLIRWIDLSRAGVI